MNYAKHYSTKVTPQSQPIPGSAQVPNSAGGYAFAVDDWKRLDRFLILGSEGGTYYIAEQKLTVENAEAVRRCILEDGQRVVKRVVDVSVAGRAPKNDPALFVLAMCASFGDLETKRLAFRVLPKVARIGTHLFHFAEAVSNLRGWGRGLRNAVANWYTSQSPEELAFDAVKYQQRDGWSHRDLLRLAHPLPTVTLNPVFRWITKKEMDAFAPEIIWGFEEATRAEMESEIVDLIKKTRLPREAIPTRFLASPKVWEALLPSMPMTALIRNLGNLSKHGMLAKGKLDTVNWVVATLTDEDKLKKARIHPIAVLAALITYSSGKGVRGKGEWEVVPDIVDALDSAFYKTFQNVEPTGKRLVLALDVSGSMSGGEIAGVPGLTPRVGAAALAMVTYKVEKNVAVVAFASGTQHVDYLDYRRVAFWTHKNDGIVPLDISRARRLDDVVHATADLPFGGTDCALPMLWAMQNNVSADAFVIVTDSETWAGSIHPVQALRDYRRKFVPDAKLVVVGMTSNGFSIADPNDAGMLDAVGFDTATPTVLSDFVAGKI